MYNMVQIADFELGKVLGRGGFATVVKAVEKSTGEYVAIKKMSVEVIMKTNMMKRIKQEASLHARLTHESILRMRGLCEDEKYVYLVLEYCRFGDLKQFLKNHQLKVLPEGEARSVVQDVLNGIVYLHSHGIIHRDIKLANLLLDDNYCVKISDFGLATMQVRPCDSQMTMCGTPNVMAPEVASEQPHGPAVDMWGLGALLYTLLEGETPAQKPAIPVHVSREAYDLLVRLLQKDPACRLTANEARAHPFFTDFECTPLQCPSFQDSGLGCCTMCNKVSEDNGAGSVHSQHQQAYSRSGQRSEQLRYSGSERLITSNLTGSSQHTSRSRTCKSKASIHSNYDEGSGLIHLAKDGASYQRNCNARPNGHSAAGFSSSKTLERSSDQSRPRLMPCENASLAEYRVGPQRSPRWIDPSAPLAFPNGVSGPESRLAEQMTGDSLQDSRSALDRSSTRRAGLHSRHWQINDPYDSTTYIPSCNDSHQKFFSQKSNSNIYPERTKEKWREVSSSKTVAGYHGKTVGNPDELNGRSSGAELQLPSVRLPVTRMIIGSDTYHILKSGNAVREMAIRGGRVCYWVLTTDGYMMKYTLPVPVPATPPEPPTRSKRWRVGMERLGLRPVPNIEPFKTVSDFVRLVQSNVVKIALHTSGASARLMESSPDDFIVDFKSGEIVEKHGDIVTAQYSGASSSEKEKDSYQRLRKSQQANVHPRMLDFLKLFDDCLELEEFISKLPNGAFPVTLGACQLRTSKTVQDVPAVKEQSNARG